MWASSEIAHLSQNWVKCKGPAAYVDFVFSAKAPQTAIMVDSRRGGGNLNATSLWWWEPKGISQEKMRSAAGTCGWRSLLIIDWPVWGFWARMMCKAELRGLNPFGWEQGMRLVLESSLGERWSEEGEVVTEAGRGCWKGWKEFWGHVGHGEIELWDGFSPTGLSATLVDEVSFLLRLNMNKAVSKLIWELEGWEELLSSCPGFSMWDGISWIGDRFNINNFWRDRKVGEDKISMMNQKVNMRIGTASFL